MTAPTVRTCMVARLRKADADVRRAFGTKAGTLYAQAAREYAAELAAEAA